MISAGKLKCLVSIQAPMATQDAAGQPIPSWDEVASVWADIRHLRGLESIKAGGESSIAKASIRIRRMPGIDASMRVVHRETAYAIKAVLPNEQDRDTIDLVCEVVNAEII